MRKTESGFTLFEVLVSMFITGVALLGLALMEVHILKSSQSSFNYTVATIRANNFVNSVWIDLCNAQTTTSASTYTTIRSNWANELSAANMTADADSPPATYAPNADDIIPVTVRWGDPRFTNDASNSTLTLEARFPDSGCG